MSSIIWSLIPMAYVMGSLSTAVIVSRLFGLPDPRQEGSKNPGATNVLRLGGKKAAAITLIGDALKGLVPVLIAQHLEVPLELLAAVGLAMAFLLISRHRGNIERLLKGEESRIGLKKKSESLKG